MTTVSVSVLHPPRCVKSSIQLQTCATSYCYNKCFYEGDEFTEVDKGNHGIEKFVWPCSDEYGFSRDPSEVYPIEPSVNATLNLSNLTLLHLQSNGFSDFVLHRLLRGASDYDFNQIGGGRNGNKEPCEPNGPGGHYCDGWNAFLEASFDFYKLKEMYQEEVCMDYDPQISMLFPLNDPSKEHHSNSH